MAVNIEYNLNADIAENLLSTLRNNAYAECEDKVRKANAYREGYVKAIEDMLDRIIRYDLIREVDAENENA